MYDPDSPPPGAEVRLVAAEIPSPFAPGREVAFVKAEGEALPALGLRGGDHVVLVRRERAEHGDVAAVLDAEGRATLWKVYPERDRTRLSLGGPGPQRTTPAANVHGVVVAVLRRVAGDP